MTQYLNLNLQDDNTQRYIAKWGDTINALKHLVILNAFMALPKFGEQMEIVDEGGTARTLIAPCLSSCFAEERGLVEMTLSKFLVIT